jgi:hypothetical protein
MATRTARSLKYEYTLFIEQEIEGYKESVPRSALLAIGDEAAARLATAAQLVLTELLLCEEVDRIISRRLGLPAYNTWRRKRLKLQEELRRPEHWGLNANDALVRTIGGAASRSGGHVLIAGEAATRSAIFLAANGCNVTTVEAAPESVERVMVAAIQAGLTERVHAAPTGLTQWMPDGPLHAVVCSHAALDSLSQLDRARVIAALQGATRDGGVHLVETIVAGSKAIEELRAKYHGWAITVEPTGNDAQVFLARKATARVSH